MANGNPSDDEAYEDDEAHENVPVDFDDLKKALAAIGDLATQRFDTEDANNCSLAAALDFVCDSQDDLEQAIDDLHCGCFPAGVWPATAECIETFRDRRREIEYEVEKALDRS